MFGPAIFALRSSPIPTAAHGVIIYVVGDGTLPVIAVSVSVQTDHMTGAPVSR